MEKTTGKGYKLPQKRSYLNTRNFYSENHGNNFPRDVVEPPWLEDFEV